MSLNGSRVHFINYAQLIFFKTALFFCLLLLLISCKNRESQFTERDVFRYNEHANITSLDPAFAKDQRNIWAVNQIFSGLVRLNDSLGVDPDIAKSWAISKNGKKYSFLLRDDVYFHKHQLFGKDSTRKVNAKDFVYSFNRLLDETVASPGGWVLQNVERFYAENDSVFILDLKRPFPPFLGLLTMKYCSVVPREAIDFFGADFRENPIGTGPFQKKLWIENTKLVLRKNPLYFEYDSRGVNLPYLEAVSITFLPDKQSEFLQFIQGNLDFMKSIDASYKDDLITRAGELEGKYREKIIMQKAPYLNTEYLGIFMEAKADQPEQSELIRKAINQGFDRVKMIEFLRNNIGIPAEHGFIPKGLPGFTELKGFRYNPELSRKLIEQYKKISGNAEPQITITTNSNYLDLCEFIQRELQKIGLKVNVDVIPPSTLRQAKANGKLSIFRASWIADYPDAENYLSLFYSKNFTPNGPNYTHFSDRVFDELYETAISETDNNRRIRLYQMMDSILIDKAPIVPLYYDEVVRFTQKNVNGLGINPFDLLDLRKVYKTKVN